MRLSIKTAIPSFYMTEFGMVGDYFAKEFYSQFQIDNEAIVASPEAVELIAKIFENAEGSSEDSQLIKELIIAEGIDGYVTNSFIYLENYTISDGYIRDIPFMLYCDVNHQQIINFIKDRQQYLFDLLQFPEGRSPHLRRLSMVQVSKLKISDNTIALTLSVNFHVDEREEFFIERLGDECIRYKLTKKGDGYSFFNIDKTFYQELK